MLSNKKGITIIDDGTNNIIENQLINIKKEIEKIENKKIERDILKVYNKQKDLIIEFLSKGRPRLAKKEFETLLNKVKKIWK